MTYPPGVDVHRAARVSEDGLYRYTLTRSWVELGPLLPFVMLNPSTADAELDDATIRRCVGFARALGAAGILVVNLFAYRSTDLYLLGCVDDPVGPSNDEILESVLESRSTGLPVIGAWGAHPAARERAAQVFAKPQHRRNLHALGVTKSGAPRHPLYLPSSARPTPWAPRTT